MRSSKTTREYVEYWRLATGPSERHSVNSSNQSSMGVPNRAVDSQPSPSPSTEVHPKAPCNNSFFKAGSTWHVCHVPVRMSFANLVQNEATQPPKKPTSSCIICGMWVDRSHMCCYLFLMWFTFVQKPSVRTGVVAPHRVPCAPSCPNPPIGTPRNSPPPWMPVTSHYLRICRLIFTVLGAGETMPIKVFW